MKIKGGANENRKQEGQNKGIEGESRARKAHGELNTRQDTSLTFTPFEIYWALWRPKETG